MKNGLVLLEMSLDDQDERIRELIEEVVPELNTPKKLGFFGAMKAVWRFWLEKFNSTIEELGAVVGAVVVAAAAGIKIGTVGPVGATIVAALGGGALGMMVGGMAGAILGAIAENTSPKWFERGLCGAFLSVAVALVFLGTKLPLLPGLAIGSLMPISWVGQAVVRMILSRRKKQPELPSLHQIQERLLSLMEAEASACENEIVGENSPVEGRVAELKSKIQEAKKVERYFYDQHIDRPDDPEIEQHLKEARCVVDDFEGDLRALGLEQEAVLRLFREFEASIPKERQRTKDDEYIERLRALRGEAAEARAVSRDVIMEAARPIFSRLIPLEQARERIRLISTASLEGPGAIKRLEAEAERAGDWMGKMNALVAQAERQLGEIDEFTH